MLINKELLNQHFIIPRSSNSKFIKYLMDINLKPIVKILDPQWDEQIGYLAYKKEDISIETPDGQFLLLYIKHRVTSHVWVRPLTVSEIKMFLNTNPFTRNDTYNAINIYNPYRYLPLIFTPIGAFDPYIYNSYLFEIDRDRL